MKLNKAGRDEIRKTIENQLSQVPQGQRVHLDKELLNELLFETISYGDITIKAPFWSGPFLSKIDLSEIDFEDVSWTILSDSSIDCFEKIHDSKFCNLIADKSDLLRKELRKKFKDHYFMIDYSDTNAKIDFSKSAESKYSKKGLADIWYTNFSGTDFSFLDLNIINGFYNCDLRNTNIKVSMNDINKRNNGEYYRSLFFACNLGNVDLSKITVSMTDVNSWFWDNGLFNECFLKNTGLNVIFDYENDKAYESFSDKEKLQYNEEVGKTIKNGSLDGCYVNGQLVHSKEERQQIAHQKREEYESFKDDINASIVANINEQKQGFGK